MRKLLQNIGASVRARLLNLARERHQPFELPLIRYTLERLLYLLATASVAIDGSKFKAVNNRDKNFNGDRYRCWFLSYKVQFSPLRCRLLDFGVGYAAPRFHHADGGRGCGVAARGVLAKRK